MSINSLRFCLALCLLASQSLFAHEVRPAHLQLYQITAENWQATFRQPQINGRFLNLTLQTNCTQVETRAISNNSVLQETFELTCGRGELQFIKIVGLERTLIDTLVSIEASGGEQRNLLISPEHPEVNLHEAEIGVPAYLILGVEHLWFGIDHILFLLVLLYLVKGWQNLLKVITSFTIAHSMTLGIAATGIVSVSQEPVEALIALSIIALALLPLSPGVLQSASLSVAASQNQSLVQTRPWRITFLFGLLHGLGFAGALANIGLPEEHVFTALLLFNIGIEVGQLSILLSALIVIRMVYAWQPAPANRVVVLPLYAAGGIAMWWFIERSYAVLFL